MFNNDINVLWAKQNMDKKYNELHNEYIKQTKIINDAMSKIDQIIIQLHKLKENFLRK